MITITTTTTIMTMTNLKDSLLILQLNDTQFPIGSYSHSYGFETYIQDRVIRDEDEAKLYLQNYLKGTFFYNDLMAAYHSYKATIDGDVDLLLSLNRKLRASKSQLELREASEKLGSRLLSTVAQMGMELGDLYSRIID